MSEIRLLTHVKVGDNENYLQAGALYSREDLDGMEPGLTDLLLEHESAEIVRETPEVLEDQVASLQAELEAARAELETLRAKKGRGGASAPADPPSDPPAGGADGPPPA